MMRAPRPRAAHRRRRRRARARLLVVTVALAALAGVVAFEDLHGGGSAAPAGSTPPSSHGTAPGSTAQPPPAHKVLRVSRVGELAAAVQDAAVAAATASTPSAVSTRPAGR
jgi:hypothetical protein